MRLRNGQTGTVVRVGDQLAARLLRRGWIQVDQPPTTPPEPPVGVGGDDLPDDKEQLLIIAEQEGIAVDRRWGVARLTETIRNARHG